MGGGSHKRHQQDFVALDAFRKCRRSLTLVERSVERSDTFSKGSNLTETKPSCVNQLSRFRLAYVFGRSRALVGVKETGRFGISNCFLVRSLIVLLSRSVVQPSPIAGKAYLLDTRRAREARDVFESDMTGRTTRASLG
jgi:hypothetical protein